MENKQSYSLNGVFAKGKCITDFFSNNTGSSGNCITHRQILILMTGICGVMSSMGCKDLVSAYIHTGTKYRGLKL